METINEISKAALDRLESWMYSLGSQLPNLLLAILVFVAAVFVAKFSRKASHKYMQQWRINITVSAFASRLIHVTVLLGGLTLALSILDLTKTVSSILAGLGIVGLALGFAFQNTAANFISGIYITFVQPFAIGDIIESNDGVRGYVQDINLRVTKVRSFDGHVVYVPNRYLFQENFINYSEYGRRRLRLECGVSYGEDLQRVEEVSIKALEQCEGRLEDEPVGIHWQGFGDSSINFIATVWMHYGRDHGAYVQLRNDCIKRLKRAYDEQGITIPFPIRTLDFGIKGGVQLQEQLKVQSSQKPS